MIKQGIKTMNAEFIQTCALFQLSFVQFRPYATSFPRLLLSLTLIPKSKKTLETILDLTPSFKTSLDTRVEDLVLNLDYLENLRSNFIQKKYGRKRHLACTPVSSSGLQFFFFLYYGLFTSLMTFKGRKVKKE